MSKPFAHAFAEFVIRGALGVVDASLLDLVMADHGWQAWITDVAWLVAIIIIVRSGYTAARSALAATDTPTRTALTVEVSPERFSQLAIRRVKVAAVAAVIVVVLAVLTGSAWPAGLIVVAAFYVLTLLRYSEGEAPAAKPSLPPVKPYPLPEKCTCTSTVALPILDIMATDTPTGAPYVIRRVHADPACWLPVGTVEPLDPRQPPVEVDAEPTPPPGPSRQDMMLRGVETVAKMWDEVDHDMEAFGRMLQTVYKGNLEVMHQMLKDGVSTTDGGVVRYGLLMWENKAIEDETARVKESLAWSEWARQQRECEHEWVEVATDIERKPVFKTCTRCGKRWESRRR